MKDQRIFGQLVKPQTPKKKHSPHRRHKLEVSLTEAEYLAIQDAAAAEQVSCAELLRREGLKFFEILCREEALKRR